MSKQVIKAAIGKYGALGSGLYIGISLTNWFLIYTLIKAHVDIKSIAGRVGMDTESENYRRIDSMGPVAASYVLHKMTSPIRIPLTLAMIPFICRRIIK